MKGQADSGVEGSGEFDGSCVGVGAGFGAEPPPPPPPQEGTLTPEDDLYWDLGFIDDCD